MKLENYMPCFGAYTNTPGRSKPRRLQRRQDFAGNTSIVAIVTWTPYVIANAMSVAATVGVEEEIASLVAAVEVEAEEISAAAVVAETSIVVLQDAQDLQVDTCRLSEIHTCLVAATLADMPQGEGLHPQRSAR